MGYRRIWASLKRQNIFVRKKDVWKVIFELNAPGVQQRKRRKLVNYVWHIDGHNKLKPFGFSVHGCIDGFSRKLIWLEVTSSNKEPEIISQYYLKAVKRLKGVPKKIKADDCNEHSLIEPIHMYLLSFNDDTCDALNSFSIVSSPAITYWVLLVNICCRQTWLVEIIFPGYGRSGIIWSKWTRFIGLYQVLLYEYSTKRTYIHC